VLLASSGTAQLAVRAAEHDFDPVRTRRWLLVTVALGVVFLLNQAVEWREVPFRISDHSYGSMYFVMTGLHGLHVAGGLFAMLLLAARTAVEPPGEEQASAVAVVGYYWHVVDAVWIALYATLFLVR
jgi:cytochrome c oxidase subunit 3